MTRPISAMQFHDESGTAGWHVLYGGAQTVFPTGSFALGVTFVTRIAEAAAEVDRDPDIDLRPEAVVVRTASTPSGRLDSSDVELVLRVNAIAAELGLAPDPTRLRPIQIAITEADGGSTRDFWVTALGYEGEGRFLHDPLRRGPRLFLDNVNRAERGSSRIEVAVPHALGQQRVDALRAAGGRLVDDSNAPDWWVMGSPESHGVVIAAWGDVLGNA